MYAILDIETTGGKYNEEGITEIAIYRFDGKQVTDRLISLINPERPIQEFVVKLTGISQNMLRNAPKFYEIAKRIIEITEDCTLVAHNTGFDYRILRTEFRRLGYDYVRPTLCTVELSQKLIPNKESYSLGKLVRSLGIPVSDRHRANGDALATLELFKLLLNKDREKSIIQQVVKSEQQDGLPIKLLNILDELPLKLGVYYMHDAEGNILYIGSDKNIRKRVNAHFLSNSKRDVQLRKKTHSVTYEETANLLITQLKKREEIRQTKPRYNSKTTPIKIKYGLYQQVNPKGYIEFFVDDFNYRKEAIATFENIHQAKNMLYQITEEFKLCPKLTTLSQAKKQCGKYDEGKCLGACIDKENAESYNQRCTAVIEKYGFPTHTMVWVGKGREKGEKCFLLVENGVFKGYGFVALNYQLSHLSMLKDIVSPLENSTQNRHFIQKYLRTHPMKKINLSS